MTKPNKKLMEQMTVTERFNYISALKQIEHKITKSKDNVSESGDEDWIDGVDEDDQVDETDYTVWVDGDDDNY